MAIWRALDPAGEHIQLYNKYAHVTLAYQRDDAPVRFTQAHATAVDTLTVWISPYNPVLRSLGSRYVLFTGGLPPAAELARLRLIAKSSDNAFAIFEIPPDAPARGGS
jgi:hypothetical protein